MVGFQTLRFGLISPISSIGFTIFAAGACRHSIEYGYHLGQLAVDLYDKFKARPYLARYAALYFECIHCWKRPITGLEQLVDASQAGLETGDIEFGCVCYIFQWVCRYFVTPLIQLDLQMQEFYRHKEFIKNQMMIKVVQGSLADGPQSYGNGGAMMYSTMCFPRMVACYLFGHIENAAKFAKESRLMSSNHVSPILVAFVTTFDALTGIAMARKQNRRRSRRAKKISRTLWRWSSHAPENYIALHLLIVAELASLARDHSSALPMYENAIAMFERQGYLSHSFVKRALWQIHVGERRYGKGGNVLTKRYPRLRKMGCSSQSPAAW